MLSTMMKVGEVSSTGNVTRKPKMSEEEIYRGALDIGCYGNINFPLKSMQNLNIKYKIRVTLPEHLIFENSSVKQTKEGGRYILEFDETASAISGRIVSDLAPKYSSDDVRIEGYVKIDESAVSIDIPAFLKTLWLEKAARGVIEASANLTIDHFKIPEEMLSSMLPGGTGIDYLDANALRFAYKAGIFTDEDIDAMFNAYVPAIESAYSNLFGGYGSADVHLVVDRNRFIESLALNSTGPLIIEAKGYLDMPLINLIKGENGGALSTIPNIPSIQSIINLAKARTVTTSFYMANPMGYWPIDFVIDLGKGLSSDGSDQIPIHIDPGEGERIDVKLWFSLPFVINIFKPYSLLVLIFLLLMIALLGFAFFVLELFLSIFHGLLR